MKKLTVLLFAVALLSSPCSFAQNKKGSSTNKPGQKPAPQICFSKVQWCYNQ